jgi:hypothetical protein
MIRLDKANGGFLITSLDSGSDIFIQTNWDYPGIASTFGWQACTCGITDGTVDCQHNTASEMISDAYDFLVENDGECVEDPGYFN